MSYQDTVQTMRVLQERIAELEAELSELREKIQDYESAHNWLDFDRKKAKYILTDTQPKGGEK